MQVILFVQTLLLVMIFCLLVVFVAFVVVKKSRGKRSMSFCSPGSMLSPSSMSSMSSASSPRYPPNVSPVTLKIVRALDTIDRLTDDITELLGV